MYFNGFSLALSNADVALQIRLDNRPMFDLKGSYTVMKTLADGLALAMKNFEEMTAHEIMTTGFVENALKSAHSEGKVSLQ